MSFKESSPSELERSSTLKLDGSQMRRKETAPPSSATHGPPTDAFSPDSPVSPGPQTQLCSIWESDQDVCDTGIEGPLCEKCRKEIVRCQKCTKRIHELATISLPCRCSYCFSCLNKTWQKWLMAYDAAHAACACQIPYPVETIQEVFSRETQQVHEALYSERCQIRDCSERIGSWLESVPLSHDP